MILDFFRRNRRVTTEEIIPQPTGIPAGAAQP